MTPGCRCTHTQAVRHADYYHLQVLCCIRTGCKHAVALPQASSTVRAANKSAREALASCAGHGHAGTFRTASTCTVGHGQRRGGGRARPGASRRSACWQGSLRVSTSSTIAVTGNSLRCCGHPSQTQHGCVTWATSIPCVHTCRTPSSSSKQPAQRNTIQTYFNRRLSGSVDLEAGAPAGHSDAERSDAAGSMWRQLATGQGDVHETSRTRPSMLSFVNCLMLITQKWYGRTRRRPFVCCSGDVAAVHRHVWAGPAAHRRAAD